MGGWGDGSQEWLGKKKEKDGAPRTLPPITSVFMVKEGAIFPQRKSATTGTQGGKGDHLRKCRGIKEAHLLSMSGGADPYENCFFGGGKGTPE